jgi:hypothetical protein
MKRRPIANAVMAVVVAPEAADTATAVVMVVVIMAVVVMAAVVMAATLQAAIMAAPAMGLTTAEPTAPPMAALTTAIPTVRLMAIVITMDRTGEASTVIANTMAGTAAAPPIFARRAKLSRGRNQDPEAPCHEATRAVGQPVIDQVRE